MVESLTGIDIVGSIRNMPGIQAVQRTANEQAEEPADDEQRSE